MADLPLEGRAVQTEDKKEVPLTVEQRLDILTKDLNEVARGVNVHGALLEAVVVAFDHVVKRYLALTRIPAVAPTDVVAEKDDAGK